MFAVINVFRCRKCLSTRFRLYVGTKRTLYSNIVDTINMVTISPSLNPV